MNKQSTVSEFIKFSTAQLQEKGIPSARLDAEILLACAMGIKRQEILTNPSSLLNPDEVKAFQQLLSQRADREPVAYILGLKEFWSMEFQVDRRVLVPRPETEILVKAVLDHAKKGKVAALDLGTGSGIIPIVLAKELECVEFVAVDYSQEALHLAKENAKAHGVDGEIEFLEGDLFEPLVDGMKPRFDFIISNPPYIPTRDIQVLEPDVRQYEPMAALDGGEDGLVIIRQIITGSPAYLKPEGSLCLEIGIGQSNVVEELIRKTGKFGKIQIIKDYAGIERVIMAQGLG